MTPTLVWSNILAWTLQIGLLVGLGALVPAALRMRMPRARLLYWQVLLVACLALPWIRTWRQEVVAATAQVSIAITAAEPAPAASALTHRAISFPEIALWLLAAGIAIRLGLLFVGLTRLSVYRGRGCTLPPAPGTTGVALLVSDDVAGPVTFGWRDPVILLPAEFPAMPEEMREAILCHELLHVERRDWLFTIAEELVRALLWFHPAIWWVLGEIQLAREQTVDQVVIETTRARGPYVDALLLMAGVSELQQPQLELAPAPMFLRRRHLKKRLMEVMKEVRMATISKTRLVCVMSAALVVLAAACWLATGAFPLAAAPQVVPDAAGVSINMNGNPLLHRSPVPYPPEAMTKGVEGTVVVQVKLDANAEVADAAVLSGPEELRKAVIQSVLTWHFDKTAAQTTRVVNIDFVLPAKPAQVPIAPAQRQAAQLPRQVLPTSRPAITFTGNTAPVAPPPPPPPPPPTSGKLDHIVINGLTDSARGELLSQLPIHEGGEWTEQMFASVREAVTRFDSHLTVGLARSVGGDLTLNISLAGAGIFSVGNGTTPPTLITRVDPAYSEEARAAKYSGSVQLSIVVGTEGKAQDIKVTKSLGMGLDEKAVEAVQQWVFRPGTNKGIPVNVRAMIEVNFRLLDKD